MQRTRSNEIALRPHPLARFQSGQTIEPARAPDRVAFVDSGVRRQAMEIDALRLRVTAALAKAAPTSASVAGSGIEPSAPWTL
jgi:hypothetical protein